MPDQTILETLPPEKLLVATRLRVIGAAIRMLSEAESVDHYISHEKMNRGRQGVLRLLQDQRNKLREAYDVSTKCKSKQIPTRVACREQLERLHENYEPCLVEREYVPDWEDL